MQVVLGGTEYADLVQWRDLLMDRMQQNPGLTNIQSNYEERKPQLRVAVDRDRAADLGVSLQTVGAHARDGARLAQRHDVHRPRSRVQRDPAGTCRGPRDAARSRQHLRALGPHRRADPALEPRAARGDRGPTRLNRFDRLRAITVSAALTPGYTLGQALDYVEDIVGQEMPPSVRLNYDGQSRDFKSPVGSSTSCSSSR